MATVSTYLNFMGQTEEAFNFYKRVFKSEFAAPIQRMRDVPPWPGMPELTPAEKDGVMHVCLPILGGHRLMGTDTLKSLGHTLVQGNNVHINLETDTREETDALFKALSDGGKVSMPLQEMFWGDYFGSVTDRFGVHWMFNCAKKK